MVLARKLLAAVSCGTGRLWALTAHSALLLAPLRRVPSLLAPELTLRSEGAQGSPVHLTGPHPDAVTRPGSQSSPGTRAEQTLRAHLWRRRGRAGVRRPFSAAAARRGWTGWSVSASLVRNNAKPPLPTSVWLKLHK